MEASNLVALGRGKSPAKASDTGDKTLTQKHLKNLVDTGKPVKLSTLTQNKQAEYIVGRFNTAYDFDEKKWPIKIQHELPPPPTEENESGRPVTPAVTTPQEIKQMPLRQTDAEGRSFVGRLEGLDTSTYFVWIDRGSHYDVVPVNRWYSFQPNVQPKTANTTLDEAELKKRQELERETAQQGKITTGGGNFNGMKDTDVYAEDLGMKRQQKKRMKVLQKNKYNPKDDLKTYESSLAIGNVRHTEEGDWDFDDDWGQSDDEAPELDAEEAAAGEQFELEDSDEEEQVLTSFGETVQQAMETTREREADDELAQFSDDEEANEEEEEGEQNGEGKKKDGDATDSGSSVSKQPGSSVTKRPSTTCDKKNEKQQKTKASATPSHARIYEDAKQRVIRVMNLSGGRMTIQAFMEQFGLREKNDQFALYKQILNDTCVAHQQQTSTGGTIRILELKTDI